MAAIVTCCMNAELIVAVPPMAKGCPREIRTIVGTFLFAPDYTMYSGMPANTFVNSGV
jgi:hypothetical protein